MRENRGSFDPHFVSPVDAVKSPHVPSSSRVLVDRILKIMNTKHFDAYVNAKDLGKKGQARLFLEQFVESFSTFEEKVEWTKWYLENSTFGHTIRHEIYENVVFPVLLDGYHRGDTWSLRWLVKTDQNMNKADHLGKQIDHKSALLMLKELYVSNPEDEETRSLLLERQIDWFQFSVHEWPAGILNGMDGATEEDCREILKDVETARTLDKENRYTDFLDDYETKVREYQHRIG